MTPATGTNHIIRYQQALLTNTLYFQGEVDGGGSRTQIHHFEVFHGKLGGATESGSIATPWVLAFTNLDGINYDLFGNPFQGEIAINFGVLAIGCFNSGADKASFREFADIQEVAAA